MAYIGAEPLPGQNREVDDISSSFNGSTTAFTLQVNGLNVSPETANNILVNIGGVIQNPGTDYTIAASTITFTTAPASGLSFFAIILGAGINTATVADQTIGTSKILDNAVTADKLAHTSVTAGSYTTADITVDAQGRITAAASGSISGAEIADQAITNAKVNNSAAIARTKLANVDVVDDTSPQLGGNLDAGTRNIDFDDNGKLRLGTGNDLQIFHNATNSFISNTTGILQIDSDDRVQVNATEFRVKNAGDTETIAKFIQDGAVELYHNNSKKFETLSDGVNVTGTLKVNGSAFTGGIASVVADTSPQLGGDLDSNGNNIKITDGEELRLGDGNDYVLKHTGSTNQLQSESHRLIISGSASDNVDIMHTQSEYLASFIPNGAVELFFNGNKKFETTSYGNLSSAQVRVASSSATAVGFSVGDAGTGFYNTGTNSIGYSANGTQTANIDSSGNYRFFDNIKAAFGTGNDLQIFHDGSNSRISDNGTGNLILDGNSVIIQSNDNSETMAQFITNGAVELYHNNSKQIETTSGGTILQGNTAGFAHTMKNNRSGTGPSGLQIEYPNGGDNNNTRHFLACVDAGPSTKCLIDSNGNLRNVNNSYAVLSDVSLKENIVDASSQWDDIKNIKIRNFNWKESSGNETYKQIGVVAQELETVCPNLVEANYFNGVDQGTKYVKSSILYMKAIKALQEAMTKIETLETKVAALEAA